MKSFGDWIKDTRKALNEVPPKAELPYPLYEKADGTIWSTCTSCGQDYQYEGEVENFSSEYNVCGGGERCVP